MQADSTTEITEKRCCGCGEVKPIDAYHHVSAARSGRASRCRTCYSKWEAGYREANKLRRAEIPKTKKCSICRLVKPREEFTLNRSGPDGLDYLCRPCKSDRNLYHSKRRVGLQAKELWSRYRLTLEQFNAILARQNGVCPICGRVPKPYVVDHCHETQIIRGILCYRCNGMLAGLENRKFFERAQAYLGSDWNVLGVKIAPDATIHKRDKRNALRYQKI